MLDKGHTRDTGAVGDTAQHSPRLPWREGEGLEDSGLGVQTLIGHEQLGEARDPL